MRYRCALLLLAILTVPLFAHTASAWAPEERRVCVMQSGGQSFSCTYVFSKPCYTKYAVAEPDTLGTGNQGAVCRVEDGTAYCAFYADQGDPSKWVCAGVLPSNGCILWVGPTEDLKLYLVC